VKRREKRCEEKKAEWQDGIQPRNAAASLYMPRCWLGGDGNPLEARAIYLGDDLIAINGPNSPQREAERVFERMSPHAQTTDVIRFCTGGSKSVPQWVVLPADQITGTRFTAWIKSTAVSASSLATSRPSSSLHERQVPIC